MSIKLTFNNNSWNSILSTIWPKWLKVVDIIQMQERLYNEVQKKKENEMKQNEMKWNEMKKKALPPGKSISSMEVFTSFTYLD